MYSKANYTYYLFLYKIKTVIRQYYLLSKNIDFNVKKDELIIFFTKYHKIALRIIFRLVLLATVKS